ncbi:hypothetical protein L6164_020614 [Bauhinia variegata]|uniref:Uncharacterized protein n=1 Tax=Bauhinia variegata TaxID=167791 RepID=A0ACB9MVP0_BAUVA|nr:hypothetical protein L6164_020614 [Bauhinia variegata]
MGFTGKSDPYTESSLLIGSAANKIPEDKFHLAYIIYFTLGLGVLLPSNAFITAVDYFSYLYPEASVDRVFAVAYTLVALVCLFIVILYGHNSDAYVRINMGMSLFVVSLLVVPIMDAVYIKGQVGLYGGFYVTTGAMAVSGLADALVQGGSVGAAGELPERYMQAVVAGTAASRVLVSLLRIFTKAVYSQDASGLRNSANLYFAVSVVIMFISMVSYNVAHRLPVIKYYNEVKIQAFADEQEEKEDVHSQILKDWYPIILITGYNVFDLVGKSLTAVYLLENARVAVGGCVVRLLFFPLFYGCLHGPKLFRDHEIPVTILTCLLGLTNGYLTSVLMILVPKTLKLQHAEAAGIVIVLFLFVGLAAGSIVSWFWVI